MATLLAAIVLAIAVVTVLTLIYNDSQGNYMGIYVSGISWRACVPFTSYCWTNYAGTGIGQN
jgi:hypothetical protein